MFRTIASLFTFLALTLMARAQDGACNAPAPSPSVTVSLPASPFAVKPSKDGCWVFVSLTGRGENQGIAVLKRSGGNIELVRVVPLQSAPTGITLTHDGKLLIAAATSAAVFVDVQKMINGSADAVVGTIPGGQGSIYANTTSNDKLAFIAEEYGQAITVIDLERARRDGFKPEDVIGKIPVGLATIALTFSPDEKWLYTTSQLAMDDWKWPRACKPEGRGVPDSIVTNPEGAVMVVDVAKAKTDPAHAVAAKVPAACSPVRMSISPKGDRIYVTARNSNAVAEFDTSKLVTDGAHAMVGIAPVGDAPVPVMVVDKGRKVLVGNSNRFAGRGEPQSLIVLDAAKIKDGKSAVLGTIPAGSFPREMAVSSDERTLFLTNFGSNSLQVMDIARLPIDPKIPPEIATNAEALAHRHDYKPVTVDPNVLNRYAGVYRCEGCAVPAIIGVDGDQLRAKLSSAPAQNALPESDTKFYAMGIEIEFPKVAEGGHAEQVIMRGRQDTVLKRLDDAAAQPFLDAAAAFEKRMKDNTPFPGGEDALRQLIAGAVSGKPVDAMLAPGGQQSIPQFQQQATQMGPVKSIKFQAVGPAGPDIYMVESEKGTWVCRIWMTADGKVERVLAQPTNSGSNSGQVMSAAGPSPAAQKAVAADASYAAAAATDKGNASSASAYATQASSMGAQGQTRSAASAAASAADTAAAAVEAAAAAVESDVSKATTASAAGDKAAANAAQAKAATDYSALQAADAQLAKAATDLATAAAANAAFYGGATTGNGAINDMGAQDASAAANVFSAVMKGETAGYSAAAANEAAAVKDANSLADDASPRAAAFRAAATAEAAAQAAATAAAAGGSASAAAAAVLAAATAGATADGDSNPFAGAVETAVAAVAHAISAALRSQQAMSRLKALQ